MTITPLLLIFCGLILVAICVPWRIHNRADLIVAYIRLLVVIFLTVALGMKL